MARPARRALLLVLTIVLLSTMSALPSLGARGSAVALSASSMKPFIGERVTFTATVSPDVRGRTVRFEVKTANGWQLKDAAKTDRQGKVSVAFKFARAGRQQVRAVALPHRRADRDVDTVTVTVRKRATEIVGTVPAGPWRVDEPVVVGAAVVPAVAGRSVQLERSTGSGWQPIGAAVVTDSRGEASLSWTPTAAGTHDYRVSVAATEKRSSASSPAVTRTVEGDGALELAGPEWVLTGEVLEVVVEVTAPPGGLDDVEVSVTAPEAGEQVSPPNEVPVDAQSRIGVVTVGDVPAGRTERRRLRWRAPDETGVLPFAAEMSATADADGDLQQTAAAEVDVLTAPSGGGAFGGGLELTRESRAAPDHPDRVYAFCDRTFQPADVPTFGQAKAAAEAYLAQAVLDEDAWNDEPALDDPLLVDQVVMMALADQRPAAALAAALRGHELAPNDAVHLTNAAVAANQLQHPEWAVAFTRQAKLAGPAPSVGAPQEAIRLATQAHALALLGQRGNAVVVMRDALMVDPDNPQLHAQLGTLLACEGDKAGALPHVRRGLRSGDATDPMESPEDYPEDMRTTWLGASDLFDLSGGTEDETTTPSLPASWAELVARGRLKGNGYYQDEYERLHERYMELSRKRNELRSQLNAQLAEESPAWRRRTEDILRLISTRGDQAVLDAWESQLEFQREVISLNNCEDGQFSSHPFCRPDNPTDVSCSLDETVFKEWLNRLRGWETALNDYHDAAWPVFTGLQANLADPTAHALAGVHIEMHFLDHGILSLAQNLTGTADQFTFYDSDQGDPESCLTPAAPGEPETAGVEGTDPEFCSPDSVETKFSVTIDLGIMSFGFDCEKVSVETGLGAYGFLEAFARVEQSWNTSAVTYYVGVQAGAPFLGSYESALFLETDAKGRVQDLGIESGVSSSAGYVVEVELYSNTSRVSAMSYFTSL